MPATFNELFPEQAEPFKPIEVGRSQLDGARRAGLSMSTGLGGDDAFSNAFGDLLATPPTGAPASGDAEWADYGKAALAGVGDIGVSAAGAGEYLSRKLEGQGNTPFEQGMGDLAGTFQRGRQASQQFAQNWFQDMSPEAQARAAREVLTLDPSRTLWQGGPGEFLSSVGLKMARSAPSTAVTLLPGSLIMRAGMGSGAITYLGASEAMLSMGNIAANIAQEVEQAPESELMQSPRYAELRQSMDDQSARQQLISEAQGNAPLYGGLIVGAISAAAGRYLEPVFTDKAAGLAGRFGRGFASEGMQEAGQSGAEQIAQNAAAQLFDTDRSLFAGVPEQAAQGALVGGAMGGATLAAVGPRPESAGAIPTTDDTTAPGPASPPSPPSPQDAGESFESVFGDLSTKATQYDTSGQGLLFDEPVASDVQAAIRATNDDKTQDMFAESPMQAGQREQQSFMQKPWPVAQQELPLQQPQTGLIPTPGQMNLPLRERARGQAPQQLEPMAAQPLQTDMGPPAGFEGAPASEPGIPGRTRADFLRGRQALMPNNAPTFRDENQMDLFPPEGPQMPDAPSAEPLGDLLAQLEDLRDPDSDRLGVYLSSANIEQLRRDGTFEQVRGAGVPLANFDGRGGTLIAKDRGTAQELIALRDEGADMQAVLGLATGAGVGKPADGKIAVQQRDEQGNVVRETLVASPEEADALAQAYETGGRESVILSAPMAIRRREQLLKKESRQAGAVKDEKQTKRRARQIIEEELGDGDVADLAMRTIGQGALSDEAAARRLVERASRTPVKEVAEELARVARKISAFEVGKIKRAAEETATVAPEDTSFNSDPLDRERLESNWTDEQLKLADDEEVETLFKEAANVISGSRVKRKRDDDPLPGEGRNELYVPDEDQRASREAGANTVLVVHGKTFNEIVKAHPTRSEKVKLIKRAQRMLKSRMFGGKSKTRPITAKATIRKEPSGEKTALRKDEFNPTRAFDLAPPRELSKEDQAKHDTRVRKAYHELEQAIAKLGEKQFRVMGPAFSQIARRREGDGNQPQSARDAIYGRVYLKTLIRYGQLLARLHPRSTAGLKEVEKFTKIVDKLNDLKPEKLIEKLAAMTDAEINEQANVVAKIDPKRLGFMTSKKKRAATALKSVKKLEEHVKWAKRLHDEWHTDSKFEQFVAPLMQKLIGYVTHDDSLVAPTVERRGLGYVPTFTEMRNLRYALREFNRTNPKGLYAPLKDWFQRYGYKFDKDGDLILSRNASLVEADGIQSARSASEFSYERPTKVLERVAKGGSDPDLPNAVKVDRGAFLGTPQNYNQKVASVERKRVQEMLNKERARRAALSPYQRRREDRTMAMRIEREFTSKMSYEQRKAYESLNRQQPLNLELRSVSQDMPGVQQAARAMADVLEENGNGFVGLTDILKLASSKLSADNAYQSILQRLISLDMKDAIVSWDRTGERVAGFAHFIQHTDRSGATDRIISINRPKFEERRASGKDPSLGFLHAIVHEAVHAATVGALRNNYQNSLAMNALRRAIRDEAIKQGISTLDPALGKAEEFYGLRDKVEEFVAEAFSNARFQNFLRQIEITPKRSAWRVFCDTILKMLGIEVTTPATNALELVMSTADKLFTGELTRPTAGVNEAINIEDEWARGNVGNTLDKLIQSTRVGRDVRQKAKNALEMNKEGGSRFLLSALTMEQIRDFYAKSFGGSGGPLSEYMKAFFKRNADNSANMEKADKLSRRWTALTEEHGPEGALELSRIMTESTLYGIHADESINSPTNESVKSISQRSRHADLSKRFRALNSDWKALFHDVKAFYDESFKREVALVTLNAIRGAADVDSTKYDESDVARLKLDTVKGLEKEFGDKLTKDERALISRIASLPKNRIGPYFPLMRFGDYVVTAEKVKETKSFSTREDAHEWAREQQAEDPTLSLGYTIGENGSNFTVTVTEKEVRMAESPSEADQARQDMIAQYGSEHVSQVQLKAQLYSRGASIESGSGLKTILAKLDGNPAAQAAIKDFYLRSLSDSAFRKREIKRANRRGVDYDTQHRTFASYAKSAAYYTSQLRFGWQMADALIGMQKYVEETAKGEHDADISAIRMGEVVREINTRDKLTTDPLEVSKLVRGGTELSQFMMLTSPSYWMINATQPYMVTLPWLAAQSSVGDATAALLNAQKLIVSPIVNQMGESIGGLKALWSKASAEKAFNVLEQVRETIESRGGARGPEYLDMLDKLKRESIIDLSFVAELRDIAEGQNTSMTQRVLDASRIMSHLSEVNNRILTAIAAYDLYRNKGSSKVEAEEFAKQAVSLTQFNYSSSNAPRLFQARGPLGQMGPLVFQFMKYPQHMYALLVDNFRRAVKSGSLDAKIARKTLIGLFTTHLAAGGLVGAMIQPVKWAIGLALAAFGDDDEPYTLKNALSGETYDRLAREMTTELFGSDAGEILSGGLPRAAGIDLSNRMSLGSLYFIDLKTDTAESTIGSLAQSFGGPLVNLGAGFYNGLRYMREGQFSKGLEAFLPKGIKDVAKMIRYSNEGLTDATGKEIIGAKEMTPGELFAQSIGFQPARVSDKYAGRAAINDAKQYDSERRSTLLRRFNNADASERVGILKDITEFNRNNPEALITRAQLLKSAKGFRDREARVSRYGVDLRGRERAYLEEGSPYETD